MKTLLSCILYISLVLFSAACSGTDVIKKRPGEDVLCKIVYADGSNVISFGDSLSIQCFPNPKAIEKIKGDLYLLKGLAIGITYTVKVSTQVGGREAVLGINTRVSHNSDEISIAIPKEHPVTGKPLEVDQEGSGGIGNVKIGKKH